jgi:hypothetical protein
MSLLVLGGGRADETELVDMLEKQILYRTYVYICMRSRAGNDSRYLYISTTPGVCSPHLQLARHALEVTCFSPREKSTARCSKHSSPYERRETGDSMPPETGTTCQLVPKSDSTYTLWI